MRMTASEARERFAASRVARLATVSAAVRPRLVPIVFVVAADVVYTAVDAKPKATLRLRRLDDIAANPAVCLLADAYSEDWDQLWWARADGDARIAGEAEARTAKRLLAARYTAYAGQPPPGPVIAVRVTKWSGWRAR